jgi:penicillin-binding protein 2
MRLSRLWKLWFVSLLFVGLPLSRGQQRIAFNEPPKPVPPPPVPQTIEPTWETRVDDRTCYFEIPAPRGQITDRNGLPLAQSRFGYHLDLCFPTGKEMTDAQVIAFVKDNLVLAQSTLRKPIEVTTADVLDHYHNRRMLPMDIVSYLSPEDVETVRSKLSGALTLRPVYLRFYPNGPVAAHLIGYSGKTGAQASGPLQPNELLWPDLEGREGLEKTFNDQLTGKHGVINMTFDAEGNKTSERIVSPPIPGNNVVTTIDLRLQKLCEDALAARAKRGAIAILDPQNGDVLALASWPTFNPNLFVPSISEANFRRINDDPNIPLIPRAFRSSYPAGSTFKVIVGAAALQSRTIDKNDEFSGPSAMTIGNVVFHNWKKSDAGSLNFVGALTQSCNTWFYQVGIKTGADKIVDWGRRLGFGQRTGLPLKDEDAGRLPDNDYMKRVHKRRMMDGDIANLAIGQGDLLVTPLQMAQAMGAIGNGGTFYQTRLVQQVQSIDNDIVAAYATRARRDVGFSPDVLAVMKKAMVAVVSSGGGTAAQARVPGVEVAGKTGTAQWGGNGDRNKQRTAAWFVGFAPADKPQYAFAALYEGEAGDNSIHGGSHAAPLIGKVLREIYKKEKSEKADKKKKKPKREEKRDDDDNDDNPPPEEAAKDESN